MYGGESEELFNVMENKCSICFTEESEVDLSPCGDQFCCECLEQYWEERLKKEGWGLNMIQLDCPVCRAIVKDHGWRVWVREDVRRLYDVRASSWPTITRTCASCGHDQSFVSGSSESAQTVLKEAVNKYFPQIMSPHNELRKTLSLLQTSGSVIPIKEKINLMRAILTLSRVEERPEYTRRLLLGLRAVPQSICEECTEKLCFWCGATSWHPNKTCLTHLKETLGSENDELWKFNNSKQCPQCCTLTVKEADGGCNQMKCPFCGMEYCWECLQAWSKECGFYRCRAKNSTSNNATLPPKSRSLVEKRRSEGEIGVPNVNKLFQNSTKSASTH